MASETLNTTHQALDAAQGAIEAARAGVDRLASEPGIAGAVQAATGVDPFLFHLAIFVLAIFVGYYVVWSVTPALHTPLMSCLLYTSPSPRDQRGSRMPSSA